MKKHVKYAIPFTGLKIGKYLFSFEVKKEFFDEYDISVEGNPSVNVEVELEKQSTLVQLWISFSCNLDVLCDRCNHLLSIPIESKNKLVVKSGNDTSVSTDDMILVNDNESDINLTQSLYEFIALAIPIRNVHKEGLCDAETLATIKKHTVSDRKEQTDPRWDVLKNINIK